MCGAGQAQGTIGGLPARARASTTHLAGVLCPLGLSPGRVDGPPADPARTVSSSTAQGGQGCCQPASCSNDDCQLGTLQELLHWGCGHTRWQRQSGRHARALRGLKLLARVIGAGVVVKGHKRKATVDCGVVLVHQQLHQLHACRTQQEGSTQVCATQKPPAKQA